MFRDFALVCAGAVFGALGAIMALGLYGMRRQRQREAAIAAYVKQVTARLFPETTLQEGRTQPPAQGKN